MDEKLNTILEVAPEDTRTAVEQASELLHAELVAPLQENLPFLGAPSLGLNIVTSGTLPALPEPVVNVAIVPDVQEKELEVDMDYARTNMKDLIDQGKAALTGALELADAGDTPRAYEVVGGMITAIIQANKELILLHKTRKETLQIDKEVKSTGDVSSTEIRINKAVFVGRAQDLLRSLNEIEKETKELSRA